MLLVLDLQGSLGKVLLGVILKHLDCCSHVDLLVLGLEDGIGVHSHTPGLVAFT